MDKLAKVRAEIERILKCFPTSSMCQSANDFSMCYLNDFLKLIDTLQKEPVSEELEVAAKKYGTKKHPMTTIGANESAYDFKAGAEWQKAKDQETIELAEDHAMLAGIEKMREEMMKDAVNGYVIEDIEEGNGDFLLSVDYLPASMGLKDKQKVKVIILKDEQL